MQTKAAQWIDRTLGTGILFSLCTLWFYDRVRHLGIALYLSLALTLLLLYGIYLSKRRMTQRKAGRMQSEEAQRSALHALSMLPYPTALRHAADALAQVYRLRRVRCGDTAISMQDEERRVVTVSLHQSPQEAQVQDVYLFRKANAEAHSVLICLGGFSKDALTYVEQLYPPLRLIDAKVLPFPSELSNTVMYTGTTQKHTAWRALCKRMDPAQAVRCMMLSLALLIGYILTNSLAMLFPALGLILLVLLCRQIAEAKTTLF